MMSVSIVIIYGIFTGRGDCYRYLIRHSALELYEIYFCIQVKETLSLFYASITLVYRRGERSSNTTEIGFFDS